MCNYGLNVAQSWKYGEPCEQQIHYLVVNDLAKQFSEPLLHVELFTIISKS